MASTNPDSMTNAQGEFQPSKPRDEPLTTKGHQVGQMVGNDAAPEFHAKVLPAGSAPPESTFQPNPVNETPGQADNPDAAATATSALDTLGGATSADVHQGIGKPVSGQDSAELHHDGQSHRKRQHDGQAKTDAEGGLGLHGEELSPEAKALQTDHQPGPATTREHNVSLDGAEDKLPVAAEQLASDNRKEQQHDYLRRGEKGSGLVDKQ